MGRPVIGLNPSSPGGKCQDTEPQCAPDAASAVSECCIYVYFFVIVYSSPAEMATMREELWNTLRDLTEEQFKEFKWLLQQNDIQVARLEKADRPDTVDLILQKYDCREALKITQGVFTKIDRNDLVKHLSSISHRLTGKSTEA